MQGRRWLAAVAAVGLLLGCAPGRMSELTGIERSPGRLADLQDSVSGSLGLGLGISVDAKFGFLTHPSLGTASASAMWGSDSGLVNGSFYQVSSSFPHSVYWAYSQDASLLEALNVSGWRAAFEVREFKDAFELIPAPARQRPRELVGQPGRGIDLQATLDEGTWLPLPADTAEAVDVLAP